ncbi:MAG: ABC transporter permease [Candidatus Omnitrophica bacterium]|nr:ABC transporter permease [Candidatus Omnitrophota bacterium]MDD5351923.1 ABC transporter permease [Candidatus Omnitrophota bacterium]MDD5550749.1 ABC transporter permease [Candidatus Omnitrophota bacterium]
MKFELWISWRYFITKQKERFISVISIISVLGIAIGVTALIGTLGVMTGFGNQLREKIIGANAHITIMGDSYITDYKSQEEKLKKLAYVKAVTENIQGQAFFYYGNKASSLAVRGINPARELKVTKIRDYLKKGSLLIKKGEIVVGKELALYLGLDIGSTLSLGSPITGKMQSFTVAGIFDSGYYEYDSNLVLVTIADAQELFVLPQDAVTEIGIRIDKPQLAAKLKKDIASFVGPQFRVRTWMDINKSLLAALKLEKFVMFLVVVLIVLVASFNIASTLIVTVTKKIKDIGILRSVGITGSSIAQIFALGGLFLGIMGIVLGICGGLLVCYIIRNIHHFIEIPQDIYYFDRVPVAFNLQDLVWISLSAIIICFLSTIYPAWRASKLKAIDALRYE